ncbi:MAG: hypothetical protein ACFE0S_09430 [Rhodospirillales bacterium]
MLSVENQLAWMPSTLGDSAPSRKPAQELAFSPPPEDTPQKEFSFFGDDGFSFSDVLDVINPLQHIPFVSTFYREATGDTLAAAPRVMGSTLFFGPIGLAGALANVFVEESTGKDIGQHMAGWADPAQEAETVAGEPALAVSDEPPALNPNDPVLAWARGEVAWARENAKAKSGAAGESAPEGANTGPSPESIPDAQPLLSDPEPTVQEPISIAQMAYLTGDARAAARAYAVAANLAPAN